MKLQAKRKKEQDENESNPSTNGGNIHVFGGEAENVTDNNSFFLFLKILFKPSFNLFDK